MTGTEIALALVAGAGAVGTVAFSGVTFRLGQTMGEIRGHDNGRQAAFLEITQARAAKRADAENAADLDAGLSRAAARPQRGRGLD